MTIIYDITNYKQLLLQGEEADATRSMSRGMDNLEPTQWFKYLTTFKLNVNLSRFGREERA